jgi:transcription-repair coupling factor (superfamily II helicase)
MISIKEKIYSTHSFDHLQIPFSPGQRVQVSGLKGSLRSFFFSYLIEKYHKRILYITSDTDSAECLRDDIQLILEDNRINFFPASELSPYEERGHNPTLIRLRLETLQSMVELKSAIVISTIEGLISRVPSPKDFHQNISYLKCGKKTDFDSFVQYLIDVGFSRTEVVEDVGQFAVRGGIVDIYTWTNDYPVRVEFWGSKIESIRIFNVISQCSIEEVDRVAILPGMVSSKNCACLLDYLAEDSLLVIEELKIVQKRADEYISVAQEIYQKHIINHVFPEPPDKLYLDIQSLNVTLNRFPIILFNLVPEKNSLVQNLKCSLPPKFGGNINTLIQYVKNTKKKGLATLLQCDTEIQAERLHDILEDENVDDLVDLTVGSVHQGFIFPEAKLQILTDHEIFDRFKRRKTYRRFKNGEYLRSLSSLNLNDYVVHIDYGIGKYMGLAIVELNNNKRECVKLQYTDGDFLFVSIDRLNRIQKYSGEDGVQPKLTKLGTGEWDRTKKKTKESVQKIAMDLVGLYAKRKSQKGTAFSSDSHWQKELEASFPYEETEDQLRSINEVKRDQELNIPMDRLLCGDVGFGKTEVALRAAFKVVLDGKQVAMLIPTTILAYQHFNTFKERMAEFPVNIEMLSRFRSAKEQKKILARLAEGSIDIIISTHRLLSDDLKYKDLGLLIIDEEQRFGVRHKEKIKMMRVDIDVLSLTATPIPRTLYLSLMGARDFSNIETPPTNRLPVITEIHEWDDDFIRQAIIRELNRGGQVYFVHNRVATIDAVKQSLEKIVPEAKIVVAHGQLLERKLEKVMLDFINKKYNVLVATMIIENGLDIPNVNTMIIDRSDKFGLAQLYQIRGRVGRSDKQAYAYLLIPKVTKLTDLARKRLRAIQDFTDLGSGFKIALRDMEIRGVGNILGKEQSGYIQSVGFDLYCKILDELVHELTDESENDSGKKRVELYTDPKIDVDFDFIIPYDYISDERERVMVYHRLVNFNSLEQLEKFKSELSDRFGPLTEEVNNLIDCIEIKILGGKMYAAHIFIKKNLLKINFSINAKEDEKFYVQILPKFLNLKETKMQFISNKNSFGIEITLFHDPALSEKENRSKQLCDAKNILQNLLK